MGGTVGVESIPDKGSLFWFEITFQKAAHQVLGKNNKTLSGLSVLVVDDTSANRQILGEYLKSWGAVPELVSSGEEALQQMLTAYNSGKPYDLVLLDWFMPKMDGLTLAKLINTDPRLNLTPTVLLTSYTIAQEKLDRAGVTYSLTKPIRSSVLKSLLTEVIQKVDEPVAHHQKNVMSSPTILLAEDNEVNALIARTMLEDEGLDIQHVVDGKEVVEAVKKQRYSLILMDVHMPEVDGYAATKFIRQWERKNNIQPVTIIAMTANALKGDREKCLEIGMDDYLAKPVSRDVLLKKIKLWVNKENNGLPASQEFAEV